MNQYSTYSCSWVSYLLSTSVTHWTLGSTYQANGIFWQKKKKLFFSSSSSSWWISEIRILLCFIATTSPIREALSDIMKNGRHPQKIHPWNFSWQENFHKWGQELKTHSCFLPPSNKSCRVYNESSFLSLHQSWPLDEACGVLPLSLVSVCHRVCTEYKDLSLFD